MTHELRGSEPPREVDHAAWGARFGWIVGGLLGLIAGFACTYGLELLLARRVTDATAAASRASALLVPALFAAGALTGHAFGTRSDARRYRLLAMSASVLALVTLWLARSLLRR